MENSWYLFAQYKQQHKVHNLGPNDLPIFHFAWSNVELALSFCLGVANFWSVKAISDECQPLKLIPTLQGSTKARVLLDYTNTEDGLGVNLFGVESPMEVIDYHHSYAACNHLKFFEVNK